MDAQRIANFLRDAWGALVGLEEVASGLSEDPAAACGALEQVGHRLRKASGAWRFPSLEELGHSLERLGRSFPPPDDAAFGDAAQLIGETLNVLPMVFDNIASEGQEEIPQLTGLQWRFDAEVPAAEAAMAERRRAAAPGEIDLALDAFRRRDPEALSFFGPEAAEHVESLRSCLRSLGGASTVAPPTDLLQDMFRHAHTIKGAAYTVGCGPVGQLTHALEDLLSELRRDGGEAVSSDLLELCTRGVDLVAEMLDRLGGHGGAPLQPSFDQIFEDLRARTESTGAGAAPPPPTPARASDRAGASTIAEPTGPPPDTSTFKPTLRVELARVDRLLDEAGELVVTRGRLERSLGALDHVGEHLRGLRQRLSEAGDGPRQLDEMAADLVELGQDLETLRAEFTASLGEFGERTRRLRGDIGRLRRLEVGQLFDRFSHLIRERAEDLGKTVHFVTRGSRVVLDSAVLERLVEPLTHLIQNALHHGLEDDHERLDARKRGGGTLTLEAHAEGRAVHLIVEDDGRGIDLEGLRRRALEHGLADRSDPVPGPASTSEQESLELLYLPGLSTQDEVTTGAGRGVGMDAVRRALADLGGRLRVWTRPGQGTRFTVEVPATLLVTEALVVRIGGRPFALPLPAVERLLHIDDTLLVEQEGARFLDDGGDKVELIHAATRLGLPPGPPPSMPGATGVAVRLAAPFEGLALEVEEVFETREVVIKSLGDFLSGSTVASGAFVDGDGAVVLVLDPHAMASADGVASSGDRVASSGDRVASSGDRVASSGDRVASSGDRVASPGDGVAPDRPARVLVADDSLSVRRILERRLRRTGAEVLTARDGAEALDTLLDTEIDALITDLEMPLLSGAALIRRLRRRPRWRHLPILVITGRGDVGDDIPGADAVVHKPIPESRLEGWLSSVLSVTRRQPDRRLGARP